MKKTIIAAALALMTAATAMAQSQVMNIYKTDGTKVIYHLAKVDSVRFGEIVDPEPELHNQYSYNGELTDIKSVVVCPIMGEAAGHIWAFYAEENVTDFETYDPLLSIYVAAEAGEDTIHLESENSGTMIQISNHKVQEPKGTLVVDIDDDDPSIIIMSLDMQEGASGAEEQKIRLEYTGTFATTYQTSDELIVTSADDEELIDKYISSVLRQKAADGTISYGFGDANAKTASGFSTGQYGVLFSLGAAAEKDALIDLATDKANYTLKFIDYKNNTVETSVTSGSFVTNEKDDKVYIYLNATLESGVNVAFDYFEEVTDVDDLTPMVP